MSSVKPRKPRPPGARKFRKRPLEQESAHRPPITHGYIQSFDGTRLFYSIEGQGKPLIFCYGLVCSSLHWTYQIDYFRQNYQAVWFDYRGHQNSSIPKDLNTLTIENIARDLGILMDELKIPEAVILGHSMGVNVALEFYRQQPERVAGLILAHGTDRRPLETMFRSNLSEKGFDLLQKLYGVSPKLVQKIWNLQKNNPLSQLIVGLGGFNPHLTAPEDIQLYIRQVLEMDPAIFLQLVRNYNQYDATPWLHTIRAPTLILSGDQDRIVPREEQARMHQLIPNSRHETVKHGSHCAQMDLPELFNLIVERFLREIGYSAEETTESAGTATSAASASSGLY